MSDLFARLSDALSDRYHLERELGRGGMAVVYLADDLKHHRKVAVKVLLPELAQSIGTERFLKEIGIAARLAHPHILPLHDSGEAGGLPFYVMPYVEGESLRTRLTRERQLAIDDTIRILREVASALHYAHGRGIVHRDIKPENVLLLDGQALVADFGIARAVDAAGMEPLTRTGFALGTPAYMSPEQAAGDRLLDGRSDIYSLGCLAYEMLCGVPPFAGPNPQALIARHTLDPVPPLKTLRPTIPGPLEGAIQRALAKVPADRFASAEEFAAALQQEASTAAGVPAAVPRGRRRALAITLAIAVLAAGGWGLVKAGSDREALRIPSLAVLPFEAPPGDPDQEYFVGGMHEALIDELAKLGELRVISRRTMMQYAGSPKSVPEIARELDVAGVVEGAVERDRDSVQLSVRLIRAQPREENLWAQTYRRGTEDLSVIQTDVAREVARRAGWPLDDRPEARRDRRMDPEVYEAYLRGMHALEKRTPEDRHRGIEHLRAAIDRDPGSALAYAGLARGYASLGHDDAMIPDALPRARAAALRAVGLDSGLADAHAALGLIKTYYERDWEGAERAFRRALQLNPSDAMSHYHYAWFLLLFDRVDEAIREHKLAQELDPLTLQHTADFGLLYSWIGRTEDAFREAARAHAIDSTDARALLALGVAYADRGMAREAVAAHGRLAAVFPPWAWALGGTYARLGRREDALRIARELEGRPATSWRAFGLAYVYAALGDRDAAFRWLSYEKPHAWIPWVRNWPNFAPIRDDPRFAEFLRHYALPPFPREAGGTRS